MEHKTIIKLDISLLRRSTFVVGLIENMECVALIIIKESN